MPTGISIHIGLNHLDERHYGSRHSLAGCLGDVEAMHRLAVDAGFEARVIRAEEATADAVLAAIRAAAGRLASGDILLVTYSGHGARVEDVNGDEGDGWDETWCLYDRELVDDELYDCWADFPAGARILVISDSCFSGDIIRDDPSDTGPRIAKKPSLWGTVALAETYAALAAFAPATARPLRRMRDGRQRRVRALSKKVAKGVYERNRQLYDSVQRDLPPRRPVQADVLLLSAAQDNEAAADGDGNGAFTAALVEIWSGGNFEGDYYALHAQLYHRLTPGQHPQILALRPSAFPLQRPFTI